MKFNIIVLISQLISLMMSGMSFGSGRTKARAGAGAGKAVEETKENTTFDLKLEGGFEAASKIKIIKEVRSFTKLGLKEAKEFGLLEQRRQKTRLLIVQMGMFLHGNL
ncbi:hypothetical protein LIER_43698 [Lithospermum erythrorhizon]|uniref:Large ribosomal subunit protein bL12 C-terminal domain-containing protein n=1 Tax=Lithospermum erythrorhizon TaxID=34254 RepID=A0AAV3QLE4_LITER